MEDLYNIICTTHSNPDVVHIQNNLDTLFDIITYDFTNMAHISAKHDYTRAYLGLYSKTFAVDTDFIIYDYLFPSDELTELIDAHKLPNINDKLVTFFEPFTVHIEEIDDVVLIYIQWVNAPM